jgi:hypothetical protein
MMKCSRVTTYEQTQKLDDCPGTGLRVFVYVCVRMCVFAIHINQDKHADIRTQARIPRYESDDTHTHTYAHTHLHTHL